VKRLKVVILAAIKEEYNAVLSHLSDIKNSAINGTEYQKGIFKQSGRDIASIFIKECGQVKTLATLETERALIAVEPDISLFVGIAGSRKPHDFSSGDVIFACKIYSYEGGKSELENSTLGQKRLLQVFLC